LPGLRPDLVPDERFFAGFFAHGASDDGGRGEFDESAEDRRFNSAISSACSAPPVAADDLAELLLTPTAKRATRECRLAVGDFLEHQSTQSTQ